MSWLNATNTENGLNAEHWLKWAEIQSETIDESLIDLACDQGNFTETQVQEVQNFDKNLKLLILPWMGSDAFLHIRNAVYGLDAWRLVNLRFSSRTAGTKRNILVRLLSIPVEKSHKDFKAQIHRVDELIRNQPSKTPRRHGRSHESFSGHDEEHLRFGLQGSGLQNAEGRARELGTNPS